MATELDRQANAKRDFIASTQHLTVSEDAGLTIAMADNSQSFGTNSIFRRQLAEHYKVPYEYVDRLRTTDSLKPLFANTFNTFLQKQPSKQMVRTLDGNARAFRSDRFRPLDNIDLAEAVLPVAMNQPGMRMESSQFTESRFYMKLLFPKLETEIKKGDVVQLGLAISNSEVGMGALVVEPLVYRLVCLNGLIVADYGHRRYHVGKKAEESELSYEMYSNETKQLDDAALFAKIRDTVKGLLKMEVLETVVAKMREATEQPIEGTNIANVVEVVSKKLNYTESTKHGVLKHLIMGGDLTRYGLMNAITRQSQDEEDYDMATKLERDGSRVIELARNDWKQIADAALAKAA
jgi:hypothetical protein